jgi:uncharacterized membrane protein YphA (DoxX/SURF4 family)
MQKIILFIELYAKSVLRYGMAAVILWFSIQQLLNAQVWTAYVPDSAVAFTHLSAVTLVYFNAMFELVFGVLLLIGWQSRIVAFLLAVHLFDIMCIVGYGEIGVRDFGLALATFVVFMNGPDILCIQQKKMIETMSPLNNFSQPPRRLM